MQWIKCSDKLPDKEKLVICYSNGLKCRLCMLINIRGQTYWLESNGFSLEVETAQFSHWMPLPDLPQE